MRQKARQLSSMLLLACAFLVYSARGQDTLRLTIPQAEELFLKNNLSLLAAQYNIKSQEALIRQAKVWDNPVLNTDQNLYDGERFFQHGKTSQADPAAGGQIYVQVQQLIRTADKRGLQVQLAQDATKSSEAQFNDLMRNLRYVLTTDLDNLSQLQSVSHIYETEITNVQKMVQGMDEMYKLGDISQKDNVRIKALLYSLQSDYADNLRQQQDLQKDIRTFLHITDNFFVKADVQAPALTQLQQIALAPLLDSVKKSRPDVALATTQATLQQHNLSYQKALAVPDLTVGVEYDKASSYIPNYWGLSLSLPLPVFNKNRGNIVSAQWNARQAQTSVQQVQTVAQNEVIAAYNKLLTLIAVQKSAGGEWQASYDTLLNNMIESYRLRKVSLVDFIDFFESYKDTKTKQMQQQTNLLNALAELNFVTNQNVLSLK
jgi:cobalt-zinc-cadmium efflux system outer membrane protein